MPPMLLASVWEYTVEEFRAHFHANTISQELGGWCSSFPRPELLVLLHLKSKTAELWA
jgi:hypothetical protein